MERQRWDLLWVETDTAFWFKKEITAGLDCRLHDDPSRELCANNIEPRESGVCLDTDNALEDKGWWFCP